MVLWTEEWAARGDGLVERRAFFSACATAVVAAVAVIFACHRLPSKSLWLDETVSVQHARAGLGGLWKTISGGDPNGGLYYALLHFWIRIFGTSEAAVRSLSVACGAVAVIGIVMLGNRLFGSPTGLISGLLLALAPFFITYERTARSYALVVALVIWSSYFFVVELERPSRWSRAAYVLTSALAIYAHYFAAWVLLIQLGTLLAVKRRAGLNRRWVASGAWIVLLCVPEVIAAFHQGTGGVSWIPSSSFGDLTHMPIALAGGGALASCLLVLGLYALVNPPKTLRGWRTWFPAAWFLVPVLLTFVFSLVIKPMFLNYYLIVAVPGIALLATVGLLGLRFHVLQVVALGILIVAAFAGIRHVDQGPSREDYRGATDYMLAHQQLGDAVVYYPAYTSTGFDYYLHLRGNAGPEVQAYQPGQSLALNHRRIWLVVRGDLNVLPAQDRQLETAIRADHAQVGPPAHFINLSVFLFRASN